MAFNVLDKDGSGEITSEDIAGVYDVSQNKDFLDGTKTKEEILAEFLNEFDGPSGNNDGVVDWQEFSDYYSDMSMSIPSDQYFVQMMETTWQVNESADPKKAEKVVK
jgi:Ca2+-binding EF-hand superfamily protein